MTFKLTERDKRLLVFLGIFLLLTGFGVLLILPAAERREELKRQIGDAQTVKETMTASIENRPFLEKQYKEMRKRAEETLKDYYPRMTSQEIDREITGIVVRHQTEALHLEITMKDELPKLRMYYAAAPAKTDPAEAEKTDAGEAVDIYEDARKTEKETEEPPAVSQSTLREAEVRLSVRGRKEQLTELADDFIRNYPGIHIRAYAYSEPADAGDSEKLPVLNMELLFYMCEKESVN